MDHLISDLEGARGGLQATLDAQKSQTARNQLGQFSTPWTLALDVLTQARELLGATAEVRFLDPALGTGVFFSALRQVYAEGKIAAAVGYEIDPHYGVPANQLWEGTKLSIRHADFTAARPDALANLLICNPPYVRHHHLSTPDKARLSDCAVRTAGMRLSGLAGLYCYFLAIAHPWMAEGAVAGWLIPSEFMDVNYGQAVKKYLLDRVTLLRIHRFDPGDVQFPDALVSSAVVWIRNTPPPKEHQVSFTFGGTICRPVLERHVSRGDLVGERKWTRFPRAEVRRPSLMPRLGDFFRITRGIATGDNGFFILTEDEIRKRQLPKSEFIPILPSPRHLPTNEIHADDVGNPILDRRLFLLNTKLPEHEIARRFPALSAYLEEGKQAGIHNGYLCRHRLLWYLQEDRPAAPIVCTYLGRNTAGRAHAFRFIRNHSRATVANVYLAMYPTERLAPSIKRDPEILRQIWVLLNSLDGEVLTGEGRVYGGGLHKLEPKELANVALPILDQIPLTEDQVEMFSRVVA
jgi:adenine-specific DNA-methyltransferase